ncbi:hypothetical protein CHUAL_007331 [Chamberlinius hualienensis]
MALQQEEERKKRGFFGFMFKKTKSSIGDTSSDGHSSRGVSPARSDNSEVQSISPPASTVGQIPPTRRPPKKRLAPPPPPVKPPAPKPPPRPAEILMRAENLNALATTITHSRNSSDSSGYHEASILSDSPESANGVDATDGRRQPSAQYECKVDVKNGSSSNLTKVNSTSSLSMVSTGLKKRKAPSVPPPPAAFTSISAQSPVNSPSTPPPPSLVSSTFETSTSPDEDFGDVAKSTTSKLSNNREEIHVNGHSRNSSAGSRKSINEEYHPNLISKQTFSLPVPFPRQSKTSTSVNTSEETNHNNEVPEPVELDDDDISRRMSTSSSTSRSSNTTPITDTAAEIIEEDCDRRSSVSSGISHCSNSSSKLAYNSDSFVNFGKLPESPSIVAELNDINANIDRTLEKDALIKTHFDIVSAPPTEFLDEDKDIVSESGSSRSGSVSEEIISDVVQQHSVNNNHAKGGPNLTDMYDELSEPINSTPINLNPYHNQFNLARHSITSRWGRLVSLPDLQIPESILGKNDNLESDEGVLINITKICLSSNVFSIA